MLTEVKKHQITCTINGKKGRYEVYPMSRLIDLLREAAGLTGTKEGCSEGECGACSVLLNEELVNSCLVPAIQAEGATITTIEGLSPDGSLIDDVQKSFIEHGAVQCGMCTPGMVMAVVYLLRRNPRPSDSEIKTALAGNLCRCTGYTKIFEAVSSVCRRAGVVA